MVSERKVVLVTGATKRIGLAIANRLEDEGWQVARHGRVSGEFPADLESVSEIERLFEAVYAKYGRLDALVNNAARFTKFDPLQITEADWDYIHSINLKAVFFCCQQAAKRMPDGGRIVNLSSLGGLRPWAEHAHYCASKAGVIMLTKALARAWAPKLTVNSVAPGVIPFESQDERVLSLIKQTPAGRGGEADEIARAVSFFLTAPDFITGQVLTVAGGLGL
jgi:NAD(P)-dependent dehydrogenase (short-subunit alcohol dehydrogenase family)